MTWKLLVLTAIIPLRWGRGLCTGLARLGLRSRGRERRLAEANLARALPERSLAERQKLLRDAADHLGRNLFNTLAAPRLLKKPGAVIEEIPSGADNKSIAELLRELGSAGRGVFILTGHIGCWELAGGWIAQTLSAQGLGPAAAITGTIHNPPVDRLVQNRRRALGFQVLPREQGAAPLIRLLRAGGYVAVLQDQRTSVRNRDVPFFGIPAPTPTGMAALALKYGVPVLPVAGVWDEQRQVVVMHHQPPIRPEEFAPDDQLGFLTRCNGALEEFIRRNPEQWVWFHRRWNPEP
ncbi:MAG: hypothetical protein QNL91_16525 [Candidatus Krumholzibacteria bacterium]|nr:hypothetical protein [Candidatus Krumholzibacteria bacterium]